MVCRSGDVERGAADTWIGAQPICSDFRAPATPGNYYFEYGYMPLFAKGPVGFDVGEETVFIDDIRKYRDVENYLNQYARALGELHNVAVKVAPDRRRQRCRRARYCGSMASTLAARRCLSRRAIRNAGKLRLEGQQSRRLRADAGPALQPKEARIGCSSSNVPGARIHASIVGAAGDRTARPTCPSQSGEAARSATAAGRSPGR